MADVIDIGAGIERRDAQIRAALKMSVELALVAELLEPQQRERLVDAVSAFLWRIGNEPASIFKLSEDVPGNLHEMVLAEGRRCAAELAAVMWQFALVETLALLPELVRILRDPRPPLRGAAGGARGI